MKLRIKAPTALNNPSRWHQQLKPWFDVVGYQRRIDQIVGVNRDGKSIIRLVWGQEVWQRVFNEETPRYWTRRLKVPGGHKYWTVPRWMLEKRMEPEQYAEAWEASRWSITDPDTGKPVDKGPAPPEFYSFAYLCAEHESVDQTTGWAHCCTRAYYTDRSRCWGRYRPPSDDDLQLIAQAVRQMEADKYRDPYRPLTTAELAEIELTANMQVERAQEEFEAYEAELMREAIKLHGWRIFEHSPKALHHGKVFDFGKSFQQSTETGLYTPE